MVLFPKSSDLSDSTSPRHSRKTHPESRFTLTTSVVPPETVAVINGTQRETGRYLLNQSAANDDWNRGNLLKLQGLNSFKIERVTLRVYRETWGRNKGWNSQWSTVHHQLNGKLGGGFKYFLFSPRKLGEMIHVDEHIFQMGWFNH